MKNVLSFSSGYRPFCNYWWEHWFTPRTYTRPLLWSYQRVTRGWADCDVWSLDDYLCRILPEMIRHLRDTTHGFPSSVGSNLDEDSCDQGFENWKATLSQMADGIEAGRRVDEFPAEFVKELETSTGWRAGLGIKDSEYDWPKIKKYQASQRKLFKEGMKLFTTHFSDLWD